MIPEAGHAAAIVTLVLSSLLAAMGLLGGARRDAVLLRAANSLALGQWVFAAISFALLATAFVQDDFSVAYIAENSNSLLPWYYKVSAVWGAHEGSFLLWILVMATWLLAVALRGGYLPADIRGRVLGVMGLMQTGFLSFLLFTSNPFERLLPLAPADGADLNPLLQDFGLIVHPPLLYIGYVGFSVAFSFAVAALLSGRLDAAWARWSRPWTNVAWAFLTVGIALGSWWAYYELGWGGWWFWDPVENASFMPWLAGTALVHSLAVSEKRGTFKSWTVLLALTAFSLSLLGAFIVRSGVLTSVHAFAVDPTRGLFILGFLGLVVGGSLLLFAFRATLIRSSAAYSWLSREAFMLLNNLLLVVSLAVVLAGTLAPLIYEAITGGDKISVGPPYFNLLFVPLMALLAIALGVATVLRWKRTDPGYLWQRLYKPLATAVALGIAVPLLLTGALDWRVALTVLFGSWVIVSQLWDWVQGGVLGRRPAYLGMAVAHIGFGVCLLGAAMTSILSFERDVRLAPGDTAVVGEYQFLFNGSTEVAGPNYLASEGDFTVTPRDAAADAPGIRLAPQKRRYIARNSIMTEAAIDAGLLRDLYVSLGERLDPSQDAWAVRIQVKPFVRWIWFGAMLMALGGVLAILDPRYRRLRRKVQEPQASSADDARNVEQPPGAGDLDPAMARNT
ncbi:MAG: heme lyase CcmF/NrfE family subunit [Pseudomonadales bacterium]